MFFFVCFSLVTKAQYKKMPLDTNYYWHEKYFYVQGTFNYFCDYQYNVVKDTLILGKTYKKVIISNKVCNTLGQIFFYSPFTSFLRQDTILKRVIILDNTYQEKILYNFDKTVGDTVNLYSGWGYCPSGVYTRTVTQIDSILLNDGLYHKRHYYNTITAIEGVGGYFGFLTPWCSVGYGSGTLLLCVGKTSPINSTIYHSSGNTTNCSVVLGTNEITEAEEGTRVYPNPNSGSLMILSENNQTLIQSVTINDIAGRTIKVYNDINALEFAFDAGSLKAGIYVVSIHYSNKKVNKRVVIN